jgi:N-acetylmuramoyl-L-alanine amidase
MKLRASPNFDERASGISLDYIILHYTGMKDAATALARLCDAKSKVSAHYLIDEDGSITKMVPEISRAWHAGQSFWRGKTDLNSASIGIELVNPGHEFGYRPFPPPQITALKKLMHAIISRHGMNPLTAPLGHSDIAPSRKKDPGELFPWQELARNGLGAWPTPTNFSTGTNAECLELLKVIGYDTSVSRDAILAFQRRYCPSLLTGEAYSETLSCLRALAAGV